MQRGQIGIEFISVLGLPPLEFVQLAADLACMSIGLALQPIVSAGCYPQWSMREDSGLRRSVIGALRASGVRVSLGEGFIAWPDKDIREARADLDAMRELGAEQVNIVAVDPDRARAFDQCAVFADLAQERGLCATLEFMPGLSIGDLHTAAAAVRHAGRSNFRVLLDAMHFFRSGAKPSDLALFDPALIGHVQVCDVPLNSPGLSYADEARYSRLPPGEGELPLLEFLAMLPRAVSIGVEVPMLARARSGTGPRERLLPCLDSTWELLTQADALRASASAAGGEER